VSKLIFDGQSFNYTPTVGQAHPTVLVGLLPGASYPSPKLDVAVNGTTYAQRKNAGAYPGSTRVDPYISGTDPTVLIDCAGQSDIISVANGGLGLTGPALLASATSYFQERRAAGVDLVIACTVPPISGGGWAVTGQEEINRVTYNNLLNAAAGNGIIDGVADIAALPHAQDATNTTYFSDGLHPTAALAAEFAGCIEARMASMGFPT
jgi:hypothetical protein